MTGADGRAVPSGERTKALQTFERALRRESHVLRDRPELLWQQLYNRLQWEEGPVAMIVAAALAARTGPATRPWLRMQAPFRESSALIATMIGRHLPVQCCAVSTDATLIASGAWGLLGDERAVTIWDADGREVRSLEGHLGGIEACAFGPAGRLLASAGHDRSIRLWNPQTGAAVGVLLGHGSTVSACAFSPDGLVLVSGSEDMTLKLWDMAADGREIRTLKGHKGAVETCAFSPDGSLLVSGSRDETLKIWDVATGRELRTLKGHDSWVGTCAFGPDGTYVISIGGQDIKVWDVRSGRQLRTMQSRGHRSVDALAVSPDGNYIVSGAGDGTLTLWDPRDGRELEVLSGHGGAVTACAIAPNGRYIVSASFDETLKIWAAPGVRE